MAAPFEPDDEGPAELLPLALSRPNEALERARKVLAGDPSPLDASVARQAIGVVLREYGDIDAAVDELRIARRLARRAGSASREADVLATLGVALVFAGRTVSGRNTLDAAVRQSTGHLRGRTLLRRGGALLLLGHYREALEDLNSAVAALRMAGDQIWEARALQERAVSYLLSGSARRAVADLRRAEDLFTANGQELESAETTVNRGVVALRLGDLPEALTCFDEAAERFQRLGAPEPDLSMHRCAALTAAGLARDATQEAEAAISQLDQIHGRPTKRAELLLAAARCALAAGEPATALARATEARRLFDRQGRRWWRAHAQLAQVSAGIDAGPATPALLREAQRCVRELSELSSPDLPLARLAAGRVALALGQAAAAHEHLAAAAAGRRHGPPLSRAVGWRAEALRAQAVGDPGRLMYACRRGLDVIDQYRSMLGSSELRAQTTAHGAELATLGQRQALRLGRPGLLLAWSERWRAVELAVPPVRPPADEELQADLAAMRAVGGRLARASGLGLRTAPLQHEQQRLERAVRARALRTLGAGRPGTSRVAAGQAGSFSTAYLLDQLGGTDLVELTEVDGQRYAVVVTGRRRRLVHVGPAEAAAHALAHALFALRREGVGRGSYRLDLTEIGRRLEATMLGESVRLLRGGPVVVVPTGKMNAIPWGMMPSLRDRPLAVTPSASVWLRARCAARPEEDRVVLVGGPRLATGDAEVRHLVAQYPDAVVLADGDATAHRVMAAMDGAWLVHMAAHGTFRGDSPLFSAIELDDGPLTVYDLERLKQAPYRVVLSSCSSAVGVAVGADELLGLVSALISLGSAGVVASVVPVNDPATVPLMTALHDRLRAGCDLAEALTLARDAVGDDPVARATACSFIALGT